MSIITFNVSKLISTVKTKVIKMGIKNTACMCVSVHV